MNCNNFTETKLSIFASPASYASKLVPMQEILRLTQYDNILREWEQVMGEQDTAYFYVGDVTKRNLCKTILLPPMMTYHLTMKGRAMSLSNDGKLVLNKDGRYYRDVTSESEISLREDGMTVPQGRIPDRLPSMVLRHGRQDTTEVMPGS